MKEAGEALNEAVSSPGGECPRFPAEWERHAATWIFWPTRAENYLYGTKSEMDEVLRAFTLLVDRICAFERVCVVVDPSKEEEARHHLRNRAEIHPIPLDDAWARDAGPTFVINGGRLQAVSWRFTGWGGRFGPVERDARVAAKIAASLEVPCRSSDLAIEGGAIHTDGSGRLLTTQPVLQDPGRNRNRTLAQCGEELRGCLGMDRFLVLPCGFEGDDTGGHVDVIAAFDPAGRILLNHCTDASDANCGAMEANRLYLKEQGCEVVGIPQPEAKFSGDDRLAYSYLNFYVCNDAVILPAFGDRLDPYVRDQMAELYPDRDILSLEARPFYWGGGGIHCVTQQQPWI